MAMLSDEERKVFDGLERAIQRNGYGPALRELGADVGFSHEHVRKQLLSLEQKGFVQRAPNRTRALKILRWPDEAQVAA